MEMFFRLLDSFARLITLYIRLILSRILLSLTKLCALFVRYYINPMISLSGRILRWVYRVIRLCKEKLSIHTPCNSQEELERLEQAFAERLEWQLYTLAAFIGSALIAAPIVGVIHWQTGKEIAEIKAKTEVLRKKYELYERINMYSCDGNPCLKIDPTQRYNEKGEPDINGDYRVVLD